MTIYCVINVANYILKCMTCELNYIYENFLIII